MQCGDWPDLWEERKRERWRDGGGSDALGPVRGVETSGRGLWSPVTCHRTLPSLLGRSLSFVSPRPVPSGLGWPDGVGRDGPWVAQTPLLLPLVTGTEVRAEPRLGVLLVSTPGSPLGPGALGVRRRDAGSSLSAELLLRAPQSVSSRLSAVRGRITRPSLSGLRAARLTPISSEPGTALGTGPPHRSHLVGSHFPSQTQPGPQHLPASGRSPVLSVQKAEARWDTRCPLCSRSSHERPRSP